MNIFAFVITFKIYKNSTEETRGQAFKQSLYLKPMVGRFELTKMHVRVRKALYNLQKQKLTELIGTIITWDGVVLSA